MKAVVLAAGEGIRLRPLTSTRPKHLIPVGGKPLLEHLLSSIKAAGVDEALIVVYYKADRIKQFFGDGSKFGMKLEYALQAGVRGTADATGLAKDYAKERAHRRKKKRKESSKSCPYRLDSCPCFLYRILSIYNPQKARSICPVNWR